MYAGFWDGVKTIAQQGAQTRLNRTSSKQEKQAIESTINRFITQAEPKNLDESLQRLLGVIAIQGVVNNLEMVDMLNASINHPQAGVAPQQAAGPHFGAGASHGVPGQSPAFFTE